MLQYRSDIHSAWPADTPNGFAKRSVLGMLAKRLKLQFPIPEFEHVRPLKSPLFDAKSLNFTRLAQMRNHFVGQCLGGFGAGV
jgi:hypothetical protein